VRERESASHKLGRSDAARIAREASRVIVAKGRKRNDFETAGKAPKAAVDGMLGPTGNLRAPCLRVGRTVLVGFDEDAYEQTLG